MTEREPRPRSFRLPIRLAVCAAAIYGVAHALGPPDSDRIDVTPLVVEELAQRREAIVGRILTETEREAVVESFIEEELLVREALRRGLDRGDVPIRSMLVGDGRAELLRSAGYEAPTPGRAELEQFYAERRQRYEVPERVDLDQVVYASGTEPDALGDVLSALQEGADFTSLGEAGPAATAAGVSSSELARVYGLDFARRVFSLAIGEWHGPLSSPAGTHFVRLAGKTLARERGFDEVESYVAEDYQLAAAERALDEAMKPLRRRYVVSIEE